MPTALEVLQALYNRTCYWSRWRGLGVPIMIILFMYWLNYGYAALIFHAMLVAIYPGLVGIVQFILYVVRAALALINPYRRLERLTWEFYAPTSHQLFWEALLSLGNKSLRWHHRIFPVVVDWHRSAIRAAAWFAKVCWTVIREVYKRLRDAPPPLVSPERAKALEKRPKLYGVWITSPANSDPAPFLPNKAPASPVESTPCPSTYSLESLPSPRIENKTEMSRGKKKSKPKSPKSKSLGTLSRAVKNAAERRPRQELSAPDNLHVLVLVPSTPDPPVERSFRENTALHIPAKDSVNLPSRKLLQTRAGVTSDSSGLSLLCSPPRKRLRAVNARQIAATASADGLEVDEDVLRIFMNCSTQMSVLSSVSTVGAVPILRTRASPVVTLGFISAVLPVPTSISSLSVPTNPPLASVPTGPQETGPQETSPQETSPQETSRQEPALIVTFPTPPQQTQSTTVIDQKLLHTRWSPAVAPPNFNKSISQSGTEVACQLGVSTDGERSCQSQQTIVQGSQPSLGGIMASAVPQRPNLKPESFATVVQQEVSKINADDDMHMASPTAPSMEPCSAPAIQSEGLDIEMQDGCILTKDSPEEGPSDMDLEPLPLVRPSLPASVLFPSSTVTSLPRANISTRKREDSNTSPVAMDIPSAEPALDDVGDVDMADVESSACSQAFASPMVANDPGFPCEMLQPQPPTESHPPLSGPTDHWTADAVPAIAITQSPTAVSAFDAPPAAPTANHTQDKMQFLADVCQQEKTGIEMKATDDDTLVPCEPAPGNLNAVAIAEQGRGHNSNARTRSRSGGSIPPVQKQASTHDLHGLVGASEGHEVQITPSVSVSSVADCSSGRAIQPSSPPTVVRSSPSIIKALPSSPIAPPSGLSGALPAPSLTGSAGSTTTSPSSLPAATDQKANTTGRMILPLGKRSAVNKRSGHQQAAATVSRAPPSDAVDQSSHSQTIAPTSNVGPSSIPPHPIGPPSGLSGMTGSAGSTTASPSSLPTSTDQKANTTGRTILPLRKRSAVNKRSGHQQAAATASHAPPSDAVDQSSQSQTISPTSNVGPSSIPPHPRAEVAPRVPVATSTSNPTPFIIDPSLVNESAAQPSSNLKQGSSPIAQSTGSTVTVAGGGGSRLSASERKLWDKYEKEEAEELEKEKEKEKKTYMWMRK